MFLLRGSKPKEWHDNLFWSWQEGMKLNSYQEVPAGLHARWTGARAEDEDDEDDGGLSVCQGRAPVEFLRELFARAFCVSVCVFAWVCELHTHPSMLAGEGRETSHRPVTLTFTEKRARKYGRMLFDSILSPLTLL